MSRTQFMEALAVANARRLGHADLKHEVASGELSIVEALVDPRAATLAVGKLLGAQRRWGPGRVERLLCELPINPLKPCGLLTDRQRGLLVKGCGWGCAR